MRCRNSMDDVKTGGPGLPRDEFGSDVCTARVASGIKVARTRIRLLCGTWEPVIPMQRENLKRKHREGERTEAEYRGGATRSSGEGPVMGLKRRGCPIQSGSTKQPMARTRIRLLCGTWEPVIPMQRENLKRKHREGERTEAEYRGGATRSSGEGPVMGLKRRGCPIQSGSTKQPMTGGLR